MQKEKRAVAANDVARFGKKTLALWAAANVIVEPGIRYTYRLMSFAYPGSRYVRILKVSLVLIRNPQFNKI